MDVGGIPVRMVGEGVDWPAWTQAIGSVVAILLTGALAGLGLWREARRQAQAELTRLEIVAHAAARFDSVLNHAEATCGVDPSGPAPIGKLASHVAVLLEGDGALREVMQVVNELRAADMPNMPGALGLFELRAAIRGYVGRLEFQAKYPASSSTIDFRPFRLPLHNARVGLQASAEVRSAGFRRLPRLPKLKWR